MRVFLGSVAPVLPPEPPPAGIRVRHSLVGFTAPDSSPGRLPDPPFSKVTPGSHPAARSRHISLSDWPGPVPKLNGAARASSFFMNYYKILRSPGGLVRGNLAYLARI